MFGPLALNNTDEAKGCTIRRTLSADMSSKKWLTQHGVSSLKRIASSKEFPLIPSEEDEDYEENKQLEKPSQFDMWSSIVSKKDDGDEGSNSLPPPYVHPLVKRSASCLSEKSLEICTESLGSETGADGFSSYPPSETGDVEEEHKAVTFDDVEEEHKAVTFDDVEEEHKAVTFDDVECRYDTIAKKSPLYGSFPPAIASLSRKDGGSVRIETHRDSGRLVLEAVSSNNLLSQRQDGRLVLTFANDKMVEEEENETQMDIIDEEQEEDTCREMEQDPKLSSGAMNVHRLALMMNKPIWLANRNPTRPKTFNEIVKFGDGIIEKIEPTTPSSPPTTAIQSLAPKPSVIRMMPSSPPLSSTTTVESCNAYEYYWRRPNEPISSNAEATTFITPLAQQSRIDNQLMFSKNQTANDQQQLLVLRGNNGDYFVPLLKGCRETRRSLIFLDPYCIATS